MNFQNNHNDAEYLPEIRTKNNNNNKPVEWFLPSRNIDNYDVTTLRHQIMLDFCVQKDHGFFHLLFKKQWQGRILLRRKNYSTLLLTVSWLFAFKWTSKPGHVLVSTQPISLTERVKQGLC